MNSVTVMRERGIDITCHGSRNITSEMAREADYIVCLSPTHREVLTQWWPEIREKLIMLSEEGVPDPIGKSVEEYRKTADVIQNAVEQLVPRILLEEESE